MHIEEKGKTSSERPLKDPERKIEEQISIA
jgi:hypothetical protein